MCQQIPCTPPGPLLLLVNRSVPPLLAPDGRYPRPISAFSIHQSLCSLVPRNVSSMLCCWTNPCWLTLLLLLPILPALGFSSSIAVADQQGQSAIQPPPMSTRFPPSNFSELTEPNWPLEEFDQRKQSKRGNRHSNNQLTSRYGLRIDHCPDGGEPESDSLNGQVKLCQLDDECRPSYKCQNIIGLTHFGKQMRYCCPTKTTACTEKPRLEPVIPGRCRPLRIFYYFDVDQLACVKARMAQCEDFGRNRFASELECRTKCETTACELGESILLHNGSFNAPFLCDSDEDCPVGYNCRQDRIFRRSVCCGFLDFEPCPLGFRSFTVPFSGRPKSCVSSETRDECPTDYVCTQNQVDQEHYCCTVDRNIQRSGVCPEGHQAYIHPLTDGTIKCNLRGYESTTSCPPGYACLAAVFGSPWGFCCSQAVVASCPEDSFPQINALTNQPQRCEMMQPNACTKGFVCESDSLSHLGFCCSIPRKFPKKKTQLPELIPRKKIRPSVQTTTSGPEELVDELAEVEETTTAPIVGNTTEKPAPQTTTLETITTSRGKRKGEWKKKKGRKKSHRKGGRTRKREEEEEKDAEGTGEEPDQNASFTSAEKSMERHELSTLDRKLDRFIIGLRRKSELPRGHRVRPRIWRLKKGWSRGQKMIPTPKRSEREEEEAEEVDGDEQDELDGKRERSKWKPSSSRPRCPSGYSPKAFPGTKWTYLECVPQKSRQRKGKKRRRKEENEEDAYEDGERSNEEEEEEQEGECPKPAICLNAENDPFGRALCCVESKDEDEDEDDQLEKNVNEEEEVEPGEQEEITKKRKGKKGRKGKKRRKDDDENEDEEGENEEEKDESKMAEKLAELREREEEMRKLAATTTKSALETAEPPITTTAMTTTSTTKSTTTLVHPHISVLMVERSSDAACPRLIADRICSPGSTKDCKEAGFFCQFNKDKRQFVCCSKK